MRQPVVLLERFDKVPHGGFVVPPPPPEPEPVSVEALSLDPEQDPEILRLREECGRLLRHLSDALAALDARVDALSGSLSAELARAAHDMLPSLADETFDAEIAAAIGRHLTARGGPPAILFIPPEGADTIAGALQAPIANERLVIEIDPDLAPGSAHLTWPGGGADFDARDAVRRVTDSLAARLAPTFPQGERA